MLMTLLACVTPSTELGPPSGTPEASLSARPEWADHSGYAPGLPHALLAALDPERDLPDSSGPLHNALLVCEATTSYAGDRARFFAARRGVDTSLPDFVTWVDIGATGVVTNGPANSSTTRFAAPAVSLDKGESLKAVLQDAGVFRKHSFDTLTGTYDGTLPMTLSGETSQGWCRLAPEALIEASIKNPLASADAALAALESRTVDLSAVDLGRASAADPREPLRDAAALVGWERESVARRVAMVASVEETFDARVVATLEAAQATMASSLETNSVRFVPQQLRCPWLPYNRYGVRSECALEVLVWTDTTLSTGIEMVSASGQLTGTSGLVVAPDASPRVEAEWRTPEAGEEVLMILPLDKDSLPMAFRISTSSGSHWVKVPEEGSRQ